MVAMSNVAMSNSEKETPDLNSPFAEVPHIASDIRREYREGQQSYSNVVCGSIGPACGFGRESGGAAPRPGGRCSIHRARDLLQVVDELGDGRSHLARDGGGSLEVQGNVVRIYLKQRQSG